MCTLNLSHGVACFRVGGVRAYTRAAGEPDGEWTNITDPCPEGEHTSGRNPVASGCGRPDGSNTLAANCSRCFHPIHRVAPYGVTLPGPWVLETEALADPEPGVICLPLECVKEKHYGMQINNGVGEWLTIVSVSPIDRPSCTITITFADHDPAKVICNVSVQLRPGPGPGPGPGGPGPGSNPKPDPDSTPANPDNERDATAGPGPSNPAGPGPDGGSKPVPFGFTIRARTDGGWTDTRSGWTPPLNIPTQGCLEATADAILSNARQVLGLGPQDRMHEVQVRTWARGSERSGHATRLAAA